MKLLHRSVQPGGASCFKVVPEEAEDLWHLYNLIVPGDKVQATTIRKVSKDAGGLGGADSERVKVKLCVVAETVDYDATAGELRVKGRNLTENEYVKLGAYHSLDLGLNRPVSFEKESWDSVADERLKTACDPAASADLAAIVVQEGLAHLCLVGSTQTIVKARIEVAMPRKHGPAVAGFEKAFGRFFEQVLAAVLRHVDFAVVRCVVVAGPGFTKDQLLEYLFKEAQRRELRGLVEARPKFMTAHASSGFKHALKEALAQPAVAARIKDTKASQEVAALDSFYQMMAQDSSRAFYGPGHVRAAAELGAIQTLLLTDALFRTNDVAERRRWVALVDSVKAGGGDVHVFSSAHVSGEQLGQISGAAAVLRFPLPELEDQEL